MSDHLKRIAEAAKAFQADIDDAGAGPARRKPVQVTEITLERMTHAQTTEDGGLVLLFDASPNVEITIELTGPQRQRLAEILMQAPACCHDPEATCMIRAHNRSLQEKNARLTSALEQYADHNNWDPDIDDEEQPVPDTFLWTSTRDGWEIAEQALAAKTAI
jgi:hypothetical protein